MERYKQYKTSNIEWIDQIPKQWNTRYLFEIAKEPKNRNKGLIENNLLSLSYGNIVQKNIDSSEGLLPESFETYQIVEKDDLVFRFTDLQNDKRSLRSAICRQRGIITSAYVSIRFINGDPKYFNYLMRFYDLVKVFYAFGSGMRQSIKFPDVKRMLLVYPPLEEQKAIAAFLDRKTAEIDELIAQKQRLIALYEEEKTAIINEAVTKGINPDVKLKPTAIDWLGDIPEHWNKKQLKFLTSQIGDGIHTTPIYKDFKSIYFVNGTNLINGKITITSGTRSVDDDEYKKYKINLQEKSILLSLNGTIGKMAFYEGERVVFGKSVAYIELSSEIIPEFIYLFLKSHYIFNYFEDSLSGTTIRNLSLYTLRNTQIFFPPIEEQQAISEYIEKETTRIDNKIAKTKRIIELQKEYRTALISEAVTGKIKVPALVS
ncbi:MAG: restriction endonuclease subunit S [Limnothrix sp.]